jgi:hypothetical protein
MVGSYRRRLSGRSICPVPFSVSPIVTRSVGTDLPLPVGAVLGARVLSREGERGTLLLLGARLAAQLPEGVKEGDALRVRVQEASPDRLVLKVVDAPQAQPAQQAQLTALPPLALPGGATARLFVEPDEEGDGARGTGERPRTVYLHYESPALGNVDIALTLTPATIGAAVQLIAGEPARVARAGVGSLKDALASAAARPALVQVLARDATVDLRA